LWGVVVDNSGVCISGATVRVVRGQAVGDSTVQRTGDCNAWEAADGFAFTMLTPGVPMTLRASAPGYVAREVTAVPQWGWATLTVIALPRE
jgi:hypothetical protein